MGEFILSCCSTADLSREHMEQRDIHYVCFHYILGDQEYLDDMGQSLPVEELYQRMVDGEDTKTSQVTIAEYEEYFEPFLKEGKDILHIAFSSGLSGTYNSARLAVDELKEKYPERKIYLVDSLAASSGYGLIMETLADMRDSGMSIGNLYGWIEDNKLRMQHWFFSTDLTFYIRGGRVSKTAGMVGSVLNICPFLNVDHLGRLQPREKLRGKKKVIARMVEMMETHAEDGLEYHGKCFLSHSVCEEDARKVADLIEQKFPRLSGKVELYPIGATIGSHTGPGTVALFFWGDERKE
jgi:DegV family protein with EDD domain